MLKIQIKVHLIAQNRFLDDIFANNPGTKYSEKNGKQFKKPTSGALSPGLAIVDNFV
jgi:hypothetical protein